MPASGSSGRPYSRETFRIVSASSRRPRGGSASAMFSATVSASNSEKCWNTMPMPSFRASAGLPIVTGSPSQRMRPSSGASEP